MSHVLSRTLVGSVLLALLAVLPAVAAQTVPSSVLLVRVTDAETGAPLTGATVVLDGVRPLVGASTDLDGLAQLAGAPAGAHVVVASYVGFEPARVPVVLPLTDPAVPVEVALGEDEEALDDVVVSATRSSRTIAQIPTRVETIAGEEIDEKISMEPSNITMLLNESPGIVVQQTSAVSGNASIRIQGLDGRYTQLLKDGFPLYGGFSGGLSLLQVPPLDLSQVEIVKGPASTLYGGGAIAGLVNLVSKTPGPEAAPAERSVLLNATSAGGLDAGAFLSDRIGRLGYTVLASANGQGAYDGDGDAFTNLPRTRRLTVAPRGFVYGDRTTAWAGVTATVEDREGGDLAAIEDGAAGYAERSESRRLTAQARLDHVRGRATMTLKQSATVFDRSIALPGYRFEGAQTAAYSEASALVRRGAHDVVAGLDLRTDAFDQRDAAGPEIDYSHVAAGAFVQDTWDASDRLAVELGLRGDLHNEYGVFVLPRASALVRVSPSVSVRATGGLGYKAPTVFLEPSEGRAFRGVVPLDDAVEAETSVGGTVDVHVQTVVAGRVTLSFNQAAYLTRLDDALVPAAPGTDGDVLRYRNADGAVLTRGLETNARLGLGDLKLFLGYVYLDATEDPTAGGDRQPSGRRRQPLALTPAHKTYSVLVWEREGQGRIGLEAYYTGSQRLTSGERTPGYWVGGVMGQWAVGPARLFLNFENVLDTQQTDYGPVVLGPRGAPTFADIWAPTDGFIVNGGVKLDF